MIVEFDMMEYQRKHNSRAVKKTLSIPGMVKRCSHQSGSEFFPGVLQEALMEKVK